MAPGPAAAVKFLRHLAAASLVVAGVVLLGLAWNHFAASTLTGGLQGPGRAELARPPGAVAVKGRIRGGPRGLRVTGPGSMNLGLSSMFDPVNLPYLRHTVVVETGLMAAVVIIDVSRRKVRRARRTGQLDRAPSGEAGRADG